MSLCFYFFLVCFHVAFSRCGLPGMLACLSKNSYFCPWNKTKRNLVVMEKENNPIYARNTLEFVTVALEYCTFAEKAGEQGAYDFVDKATKLLPLLYLKASLLPDVEADEYYEPELTVTEDMYESVRSRIAALLEDKDSYLETFHTDMAYSETPIAAFISENLADVYQDTGNFVALFRQGNEEVMREAIALCRSNFQDYWGQQLLNALKALHSLRYSEDESWNTKEEES